MLKSKEKRHSKKGLIFLFIVLTILFKVIFFSVQRSYNHNAFMFFYKYYELIIENIFYILITYFTLATVFKIFYKLYLKLKKIKVANNTFWKTIKIESFEVLNIIYVVSLYLGLVLFKFNNISFIKFKFLDSTNFEEYASVLLIILGIATAIIIGVFASLNSLAVSSHKEINNILCFVY